MRIAYANLALILAFISIAWHLQEQLPPKAIPIPAPSNFEAAFALNQRIKLSEADLYDLELIPRLSEAVALRILNQREQIIAHARNLPDSEKYKVFTEVRGVGNLTAQKLKDYLDLK